MSCACVNCWGPRFASQGARAACHAPSASRRWCLGWRLAGCSSCTSNRFTSAAAASASATTAVSPPLSSGTPTHGFANGEPSLSLYAHTHTHTHDSPLCACACAAVCLSVCLFLSLCALSTLNDCASCFRFVWLPFLRLHNQVCAVSKVQEEAGHA